MSKRLFGKLAATAALGTAALLLASPGAAFANSASVSPGTVNAGSTFTVSVTCTGAASGTEIPVQWGKDGEGQPHGTATAHAGEGGVAVQSFTVPSSTAAGTYHAGGLCPGESTITRADFTVVPHGAPAGGTGLSSDNGALLAAGAGTLAAGAATGAFLLMRRRQADAPVA